MDATADDSDKKRHVQVDEVEELTLILPLPEDSKSSPTKSLQSRSPKRSPTKPNASLLNIDPTATLAAISARLAIVVPPGESEITRINREVLEAMANRTKRQDFAMDDKVPDSDMSSTAPSSPTTKSGMTPALHDSVVAEEWVNLHLETSGAFLLPATDIAPLLASATTGDDELDADQEAFAFRKGNVSGPLARAGMDRFSLYRMGMPKDLVDRLYRAFYVYTNGFHNIIKEVAAHCPPRVESHVSSNAWLTFLLLLEQCEDGKYEMAMLKFKQAAQETTKQLQEGFQRENQDIESQLRSTASALSEETVRGAEKSELIRKLVTETTESSLKMADQHQRLTAQAEQIRLLKLEVLVHEDEEKKLNELLDDTRRDYEVANSERLNALSERFALDEEIRKLSTQLERVESEKANYARRMHETLFMNQALRANNDQLKQDVVILGMEKDKIIAEKQALQDQVERINLEITQLQEQKSQVDKELIENQRKQGHLEERLQTMKEQFDIEVEQTAKHQQEIVKLSAQIEEERVQTGVLEAKCNLLSAAKQNTGMRAQDKLRIERLLNQKTELEAVVEAAKLDRKKDEEQISNLRSSLEALDAEMQHSKRVYSAGQQAFLHSERTCEQLRQQMQELEKNYEKAKKNVASLKERFKMYEVMAKEQITKLEVEVKVTNAQLREVTYVNRDNAAQIDQLKKSLTVAEKESMVLKTKIEESEKQVENLENEKEGLQRNKKELDLASSTSKDAINRFILSLQNMLALVKLDEFPLDEALRELLQLVQDTFGEELDLDKVLDEDDRPEDIELEIEEDVTDEERQSRRRRAAARRKGIINVDDPDDDGEKDETITPEAETTDGQATGRRETVRMSRHRKSKLDHLVSKLHRDIATKVSLIADLENVVCDQSVQISHLITTTKQQARLIFLNECQKGMLHADLEDTLLMLIGIRADKRVVEYSLEQARIDQVLQTNRAFQAEVNLGVLRRKFDMQVIANEDLIAKIWREYEDMLYMKSLRRDKEVQATVIVSNQDSQTLVPQRNPAMERRNVHRMLVSGDGLAENVDPEGSDDSNNEGIDDSADERDLDGEEDESDEPVSVESPSRLAAAVSGYQREQIARQEAEWRNQLPSPRRFGSNSDQKRDEVREGGVVDGMPVIDSKMAEQAQHSPFTTAVLYPILPQQQRQ
ncbi:Calcium-activated potassium channel subunit alpha-1 [Phytophthora boehmeriae]|uniref:Calcium-activated potassium channel subunit alpha-1 n=1 Tax=Phytophthora boehmeriae TaxID=109152 RepID=A0A8T1XC80_9STRA|nr:Calcium-activated potassium channel subunit alpha-1 [Phytophthora boehmeriae]